MFRWTLAALVILVALSAVAADAVDKPKVVYTVATKLPLHKKANGVDGTLQLLMDQRLTDSLQKEMWGWGNDWRFGLDSGSGLYHEFSALEPGRAKLTIRDSDGRLIATRTLEMSLARLEAWDSVSDTNQLFFVTEDYSVGFGSYAGPGTSLLQITNGTFHWVKALNLKTAKETRIVLAKSLKHDWRRGKGAEFFSVSCYPNFARFTEKNGYPFVIEYTRYTFDGTRWLKFTKVVDGYRESDEGPFPPRSAFP